MDYYVSPLHLPCEGQIYERICSRVQKIWRSPRDVTGSYKRSTLLHHRTYKCAIVALIKYLLLFYKDMLRLWTIYGYSHVVYPRRAFSNKPYLGLQNISHWRYFWNLCVQRKLPEMPGVRPNVDHSAIKLLGQVLFFVLLEVNLAKSLCGNKST